MVKIRTVCCAKLKDLDEAVKVEKDGETYVVCDNDCKDRLLKARREEMNDIARDTFEETGEGRFGMDDMDKDD